MSIASLGRPALVCVLAGALFEMGAAAAHPVAQGSLDVEVFDDRVAVRAAVSGEEMLVAAAFHAGAPVAPRDAARMHGAYLLRHLHLSVDSRALTGRVARVDSGRGDGAVYEISYPLENSRPAHLTLAQDVLREVEFAPGNRWEATYAVRAGLNGRTAAEGLLLTSAAPLTLDVSALSSGGPAVSGKTRMAGEYFRLGVAHILGGYDHLLFIAALALAVVTLRDLFIVISAFTLAHSITLTLAVLNLVRIPSGVVEPMIAASIVFVALQNLLAPERSRGVGRISVAFFFGLFHGLGFAGGVLEAMEGMAGLAVGLAIVAFSAGIEIGHQLVVLPVFCAQKFLSEFRAIRAIRIPEQILRYGSTGILFAGVFYLMAALR